MNHIAILGATSAIAIATAKLYAAEKASFFLIARDPDKLSKVASDLLARGATSVVTEIADLSDLSAHPALLDRIKTEFSELDIVLFAYGALGDQKQCETSFEEANSCIEVNYLSKVSLLQGVAAQLEAKGTGTIAVISSVAGDRGRASNYYYGSAKGALTLFLQGLRNQLHNKGVHVLTIKPGFVDTPMTAHLKKGPLFSTPAVVAKAIHGGISSKKNVLYVPWFWKWIMCVIKAIPEPIFKRLSL